MKVPRHLPMIPAIVVASFALAACGDSADQPASTTVEEMMDDTTTTHEMMDDTTPTTGG